MSSSSTAAMSQSRAEQLAAWKAAREAKLAAAGTPIRAKSKPVAARPTATRTSALRERNAAAMRGDIGGKDAKLAGKSARGVTGKKMPTSPGKVSENSPGYGELTRAEQLRVWKAKKAEEEANSQLAPAPKSKGKGKGKGKGKANATAIRVATRSSARRSDAAPIRETRAETRPSPRPAAGVARSPPGSPAEAHAEFWLSKARTLEEAIPASSRADGHKEAVEAVVACFEDAFKANARPTDVLESGLRLFLGRLRDATDSTDEALYVDVVGRMVRALDDIAEEADSPLRDAIAEMETLSTPTRMLLAQQDGCAFDEATPPVAFRSESPIAAESPAHASPSPAPAAAAAPATPHAPATPGSAIKTKSFTPRSLGLKSRAVRTPVAAAPAEKDSPEEYGSVLSFTTVKTPRRLAGTIGTEAVTPVRRSARKGETQRTMPDEELLEKVNYGYMPNAGIRREDESDAAPAPAFYLGDGTEKVEDEVDWLAGSELDELLEFD